jgi:hypothetical protein
MNDLLFGATKLEGRIPVLDTGWVCRGLRIYIEAPKDTKDHDLELLLFQSQMKALFKDRLAVNL